MVGDVRGASAAAGAVAWRAVQALREGVTELVSPSAPLALSHSLHSSLCLFPFNTMLADILPPSGAGPSSAASITILRWTGSDSIFFLFVHVMLSVMRFMVWLSMLLQLFIVLS